MSANEELSFLTGAWRIVQTLDGHRYSTDDVVTAWVAGRVASSLFPDRTRFRFADIGCGIGSVALMCAWQSPSSSVIGLEAQPVRAAQARRSARYNGCDGRVTILDGDLRDAAVLSGLKQNPVDIVTGTPPYFDSATGARPGSEDSARCLFESRGGIEEYCTAASHIMAPRGVFIVVETALALHRTYEAAATAGLTILARLDVIPAETKPPLICVFVMMRAGTTWGRDAAAASSRSSSSADSASLLTVDFVSSAAAAAPASAASATLLSDLFVPRGFSPYEDGAAPDVTTLVGVVGSAALEPTAAADVGKKRQKTQPQKPFPGALGTEFVSSITVRSADGRRTPTYSALLRDLGKPG